MATIVTVRRVRRISCIGFKAELGSRIKASLTHQGKSAILATMLGGSSSIASSRNSSTRSERITPKLMLASGESGASM